jgi:hypothetical protein
MKVLKSREGKDPPATFYANLFAYLTEAYPEATVTPESLQKLKPLWDDLWRAGRNAEVTAQSTCSCDGREITPSPPTAIPFVKGALRPPPKAERGKMYPLTELREPAEVERAKRALESPLKRIQAVTARIDAFAAQYARSPPRTEAEAEKRRQKVRALEAELREVIGLARTVVQEAQTARGQVPSYSGLQRHLPGLKTVPEARPPIEVQAKAPKAPKAPKDPKAPKAPKATKATTTPNATVEPQNSKKRKLTEAEKQQALMAAIKESLSAALKK